MSVSKSGKVRLALAQDVGSESTSPREADVSLENVTGGTATHQPRHFERKAALINTYVINCFKGVRKGKQFRTDWAREIDKFGFGRYQQCIWVLCGLGYFLDLAWSQGVGLMATAVLSVLQSLCNNVFVFTIVPIAKR